MNNHNNIFITGAASGIGRETARLFADKGWYVGIVDTNEQGLESLQAEIGMDNCFTRFMDVTDPENVRNVIASFAEETGGKMGALFNNAGIVKFGHFADVDLETKHRIIDVNLKGVVNCTHYALPYLKKAPGARIINMASTSAVYGTPDLSAYSATKHALCAFTEAWDIELEQHGVGVSDILAPYVKTPLLDVEEEVYSIQKMGINLKAADIAQTVWKAVQGKKIHWYVGSTTSALRFVFWLMPFMRRFLVKVLTIKPK